MNILIGLLGRPHRLIIFLFTFILSQAFVFKKPNMPYQKGLCVIGLNLIFLKLMPVCIPVCSVRKFVYWAAPNKIPGEMKKLHFT